VDEITLTLPRERAFYGIAHLVVAGLGARLDLTVEHLDDLQLALESLLWHDGGGEVTVAFRVLDNSVEARMGPFDGALRDALEREPGAGVGLRRVLDTVVDDIEIEEGDGGDWVTLSKSISPLSGPRS
jgi:hypothetical protein